MLGNMTLSYYMMGLYIYKSLAAERWPPRMDPCSKNKPIPRPNTRRSIYTNIEGAKALRNDPNLYSGFGRADNRTLYYLLKSRQADLPVFSKLHGQSLPFVFLRPDYVHSDVSPAGRRTCTQRRNYASPPGRFTNHLLLRPQFFTERSVELERQLLLYALAEYQLKSVVSSKLELGCGWNHLSIT